MANDILNIKNLTIGVYDDVRYSVLVDNLDLNIKSNSMFSIVGGSGSGKTTTSKAIIGLLPEALRIEKGSILFKGNDVLKMSQKQIRKIRGNNIGFVFQEPLYAFNPLFTIGSQIEEVLKCHTQLNRNKRKSRIYELLDMVGIPDPVRISKSFPHHLSGGLRQRAMIAQSIAGDPELIIADEPTSNLDVTLQAHIIQLFRDLQKSLNISLLLITHELGMVQHMGGDVAVMCKGKIVETGATVEVLKNPQHSYTKQLLEAQ